MSDEFELNISEFKNRFKQNYKMDDLYSRGYIVCDDIQTNRRVVFKYYSIENEESEQAVLQNLDNFVKLNSIEGICQLIAFIRLEKDLIAVFDFHQKTLGQIISQILSPKTNLTINKLTRYEFYLKAMIQLVKVIQTLIDIGIDLEDLNRDTVLLENAFNSNLPLKIKFMYDERAKEFQNLLNNTTSLANGNKCYWSKQKIQCQIFKGQIYDEKASEEAVYQFGLLFLDIIFQCENAQVQKNGDNLLNPDQSLSDDWNTNKGFYKIDRIFETVQRNSLAIVYKLNYLINLPNSGMKKLASLIKEMISTNENDRPQLNLLALNLKEIMKIFKKQMHQTIISSEEISLGIKNSSEAIPSDSLKYSDNSLSHQIADEEKKKPKQTENNSLKKQINMPVSTTTITTQTHSNYKKGSSQGSKQSQQDWFKRGSKQNVYEIIKPELPRFKESENHFISEEIIFKQCKIQHEDEKKKLKKVIQELNYLHKINSIEMKAKQYHDGSQYFGSVDEDSQKRKGLGIFMSKVGDIYFGNWKDNILIDGTYFFQNGQTFQGNVRNGKQGKGVYRYANGNIYDGEWKDDLKNGQGIMKYPSGARYEGAWLKGKKHGTGTYYYENNLKYIGGFALGRKYGNGEFIFPNGTRVEGFWDNNHLEGKARIAYYNGDFYEGNIHLSEKNGEGVYRWSGEEGEIEYKGQFKKDSLEGFAVIRFHTGDVYEGKIKHGKRDGQGTYSYLNGDEFRGDWKNDEKIMGKYIFRSGQIFEGKFKDGQISCGIMHYKNGQVYQGEFYNGQRHGVGAYANKWGQVIYDGAWLKDEYVKVKHF